MVCEARFSRMTALGLAALGAVVIVSMPRWQGALPLDHRLPILAGGAFLIVLGIVLCCHRTRVVIDATEGRIRRSEQLCVPLGTLEWRLNEVEGVEVHYHAQGKRALQCTIAVRLPDAVVPLFDLREAADARRFAAQLAQALGLRDWQQDHFA